MIWVPLFSETLIYTGGFAKIVGFPPKSSILIGFSIIFTIYVEILGYPYFQKHPYLEREMSSICLALAKASKTRSCLKSEEGSVGFQVFTYYIKRHTNIWYQIYLFTYLFIYEPKVVTVCSCMFSFEGHCITTFPINDPATLLSSSSSALQTIYP